ncbi:MAG: OmpH family outer membrane protein [Chryseolinea sp.]
MRKLVLLAVFGLITFASQAQTATKVGYADVDYIFSQMPEAKQIDAELKSLQSQLKNQIDAKVQKFQTELKQYQEQGQTMIDAVRQNTERELTQQQQNIEKLQQDAQTTIQNKQTQMMTPVYDKVGKAIEAVAKENGFSFILNQQIGGLDVILYGDEKMDISDLVLKHMGVTVTVKPAVITTPK